MSVEVLFQAIEAMAVVVGVGFAIVQVGQYRRDKAREAAMELLHSFQTPDFAKGLTIVYGMPDGLGKKAIEEYCGENYHLVYALMTTWESLGVLVHRGEVELQLVDDFFSGPIRISWHKLHDYVTGEREQLQRDTIFEWFQWLNERLADIESKETPVPAHIAHKDWRAPH